MYSEEDLIERLGIQSLAEERRAAVLEIATHRIGLAITDDLSEQQFNEYEAIVNNDEGIIDAWLEQNEPNYKESPIYQSFAEGYEEDPERNNPAKLFANIAWIQKNVPDLKQRVDETIEQVKKEIEKGV